MSKALPKRSENYSEWYNEIVKRADLAENSAVRGCMVIKPYGYAIWEKMQRALDDMFKATGHMNAYFPLFVPKSFLEKRFGYEEREIRVLVARSFEHIVERPLHFFPDRKAVRFDHHTAANRRVLC